MSADTPSIRNRGENVPEAALLSAVGGFLDAYTYIAHGGVFANAQTGNVVLFGVKAAAGEWSEAFRHIPPLLAFLAGMATVEVLARRRSTRAFLRPTRIVLVVEIAAFTAVGLLPPAVPDVIPVVITAWAATLQVGTFRTVASINYNTTFTTGNLRSLVSEATAWLIDRQRANGPRARALTVVVLSFVGGALVGGLATFGVGDVAALLVLPALLVVLLSVVATSRLRERRGVEVAG